MKRAVSLLICVIFILLSTTYALASEYVSFTLSDGQSNANRLFTLSMKATGNTKLSSAIFEFSYDSSMLQFKEADAEDAEITCNDSNGTVKVVYLSTYGKSADEIFTLKFKALKSGKCSVNFKVYDCVNSDAEFIEVDKCTGGNIVINSSDSKSAEQKSSNSKDKSSSNSKSKSSSNEAATEDEATPSVVDFGVLNSVKDINIRILYIGILIGGSVVILALVFYFILKRFLNKKSSSQNDEEDS